MSLGGFWEASESILGGFYKRFWEDLGGQLWPGPGLAPGTQKVPKL